MSKVFNILISLAFLTAFIGIQINKHYSHGKLYSIAVYEKAETCCSSNNGTCNMVMQVGNNNHEKQNNCDCKNETELFKITFNFIKEEFSLPLISSLNLFLFPNIPTELENLYARIFTEKIAISFPTGFIKDYQSDFGVFLL